jgi:thiol-disulfide isomerase/thioredoxin
MSLPPLSRACPPRPDAAILGLVAAWCLAAAAVPAAANPAASAMSGDVVLLDFTASWCGPCRQMAPLIGEISAAGWVVRHVDVDREQELVRRFAVTGVPCYVLLVKGSEAGRIDGATTRAELEQLLERAAVPLGAAPPVARSQAAPPAGPGIPLPVALASAPLATEPPPSRPGRGAALAPPTAVDPVRLGDPVQLGVDPGRSDAAARLEPAAAPPREFAADPAAAPLPGAARADLERRLLQATARLRVEDAAGVSWGTGTVIDCRQGEALILTCGHIFRDSQGKGRIEVDLFAPAGGRGIAGQVVSWDLKRDLALVSVFTDVPVEPVRVGGTDRRAAAGDAVVTVGCNGGADPTIHHSRVTAVDKYLGPPNVQVAGQPVQGRSGGGLFAIDGTLIGVCNAADPADNEGLFAALPAIHEQLDEAGLAFVYRNVYPSNGLASAAAGDAPHVPAMPAEMPDVSFDRRDRDDAVPTASTTAPGAMPPLTPPPAAAPTAGPQLSSGEHALLDHVRQHDGRAEVICIVRPHGAPEQASEVFVLQGSSREFVTRLSEAHRGGVAPPR